MLIESTSVPPCGWNSYDSYGVAINEAEALANLELFIRRLKPHGYEYFCLDACWYADGDAIQGLALDEVGQFRNMHIDEYGRFIPSPERFPRGLRTLADRCHEAGVKFGLHVMRGMPLRALELDTRIKRHVSARARDLYDPDNNCPWCKYTLAINVNKPGAQEYYDSVVEYLADELAVDLIKFDDASESPADIEAFGKAIAKVSRPILLSISPGSGAWPGNWGILGKYGNMTRITSDVWDSDQTNQTKLERWHMFEDYGSPSCWLDLDMIPLGGLQVNVPPESELKIKAPLGCCRQSRMTPEGKRVMMSIYALSASPLIFGGDLPSTSEDDFALVTHPEVLACNRNCIGAKRIFLQRHLDIRKAENNNGSPHGWIGIFNRKAEYRRAVINASELGFNRIPPLWDVWAECELPSGGDSIELYIRAHGVAFLRY